LDHNVLVKSQLPLPSEPVPVWAGSHVCCAETVETTPKRKRTRLANVTLEPIQETLLTEIRRRIGIYFLTKNVKPGCLLNSRWRIPAKWRGDLFLTTGPQNLKSARSKKRNSPIAATALNVAH
jgi:hypothetical protein